MYKQQVFDKLEGLGLSAAAKRLDSILSSPDSASRPVLDIVADLADAQDAENMRKKLERMLKNAKLKQSSACIEDIDYSPQRGIDKKLIESLCECSWIEKALIIILSGSAGAGKSWLACALANKAIREGFSALYKRCSFLYEEWEIAARDGSISKVRRQLKRPRVIILDDWGMTPLNARNRQDLLDMLEDRAGCGAMIITSQLPVEKWHEYIGEPTAADAIMDRIVHRAHIIQLHGESMRKLHSPIAEENS
ncbi:AAA family ATPase [Pseudoalteromonas rubra]|uniref:AAA family ATPase n=1 Tax=Pseudoalteromonas rubra TaxID=43658 RepID=A0A5S3URF4_9GAMM|nr:IS21-like element helper ATPase IstB [Pseudoalteromonas rubra]QPB81543.1 AAA family ATPase [Pseudoalteromonas rubra]